MSAAVRSTAPSPSAGPTAIGWLAGVGTVAELELRQRVRSTAWYVLLGVAAILLAAVTLLLLATAGTFGRQGGPIAVSIVVFFVLLLGTLVTPALSGGVVNGDRDAGTLATTQVTLVTGPQLVVGKFLAAWAAALAFLVVAIPFLLLAMIAGGVSPVAIAVSLAVTVLELGVIAAVGVGLSALIARPIFSVVTTYLVVAALSLGTLIAFGLGGLALPVRVTQVQRSFADGAVDDDGTVRNAVCDPPVTTHYDRPSYDRLWGLLALNPYVVLADAVPGQFSKDGNPTDAFSGVQYTVRQVQIPTATRVVYDDCRPSTYEGSQRTAQQVVASTVPTWFVGLGLHLLLAATALLAAVRAVRTPARRLARGTRIA